jgi:hypothetical protein
MPVSISKILVLISVTFYSVVTFSAQRPSAVSPTLIAVGHRVKHADYPLDDQYRYTLLVSNNFGMNWMIPSIYPTDNGFNTVLNATSCTDGLNAACYAVGAGYYENSDTGETLFAIGTDSGNTWSTKPMPTSAVPIEISCTGNAPATNTCAALTDNEGTLFLTTTHDGGEHWEEQKVRHHISHSSFLVNGDVSCTGHDEGTFCAFVSGTDYADGVNPFTDKPIIFVNNHKDNVWIQKSIDEFSKFGLLWKVSCAGKGENAICAAIGGESQLSGKPMMAVTTNGGNTWQAPEAVKRLSEDKQLTAVSCIKNDAANFCVAGGASSYVHFGDIKANPFFMTTMNSSDDWSIHESKKLKKYHGSIADLSCTANSTSSLCVAVGLRDPQTRLPVILVSTDQGINWQIKAASTLTTDNYLDKISCASNQNHISCFATGGSMNENTPPLMLSSTDLGESWLTSSTTLLQDDMSLDGIAATY